MSFNDRDYTADAIVKQLGLIELHSKDGSAVNAGCQCIETKHLYLLEGLSEEGQGFSMTEKERQFYQKLADFARSARKTIETESFSLPHNPHTISCEARRESCVSKVAVKCAGGKCNPHAICNAAIPCH